jgi:hypothetical protein
MVVSVSVIRATAFKKLLEFRNNKKKYPKVESI